MSKIELDDQILEHPKFIRAVKLAGSDAVFLWLGLRAYCARQLSDGFIPDDMLDEVRGPKSGKARDAALAALRSVGLVDQASGGVMLHHYLDHSSSRDQVLAWREANAKRKKKSRDNASLQPASRRDGRSDSHSDSRVTDAVTDAVTTGGVLEPSPSPSPPPTQVLKDPPIVPRDTVKREDPTRAQLTGTQPGQNPDVVRVHEAWKATFGKFGAKLGNPAGALASLIRDSIRDYGVEDCLAVIKQAPKDGMVSGKDDDSGKKHDDLFYILSQRTFDRLLVASKQTEATALKPKQKSIIELVAEQKARAV